MDSAPDTNTTTVPIACALTTDEARGQTLEWADLRDRATNVAALGGGVRMTFPASMVDTVEDLARREGAYCASRLDHRNGALPDREGLWRGISIT